MSASSKSGSKAPCAHVGRSAPGCWGEVRNDRAVCYPALGQGCSRRTVIVPSLVGVEHMWNP